MRFLLLTSGPRNDQVLVNLDKLDWVTSAAAGGSWLSVSGRDFGVNESVDMVLKMIGAAVAEDEGH